MRVAVLRVANIARVGLKAILRNPMRSSLTMLGIVIGVACVIAMVAVASGATRSVQDNIGALGTNFIMVFPGAITQSGARVHGGESTLTEDDAARSRPSVPSVAYVSAGIRTAAQVVAGGLNWGTTDLRRRRRVALHPGLERRRRASSSPSPRCAAPPRCACSARRSPRACSRTATRSARSIRVKNVPFRVLGVLEKKGGSTMGSDQDDMIAAPYTTVMKRLQGTTRLNIVYVAAVAPDRVATAQREIETLLRQRHRIARRRAHRRHDALAGGDRPARRPGHQHHVAPCSARWRRSRSSSAASAS